MSVCRLCVDDDSVGERIDTFIFHNIEALSAYDNVLYSRNSVQNLIAYGCVSCNESVILKSSYRVRKNDVIQISFTAKDYAANIVTAKKSINDVFAEYDIRLLYEDEHFLAIDKPANLVVHHGAGTSKLITLTDILSHVADLQLSFNESFRAGIVHRLDKDTSGVMLIAKTEVFHNKISDKIQNKEVRRKYICFVHGMPIPPVMKLTSYIAKDRCASSVKMKSTDDESGKYAVTNYRLLGSIFDVLSAIECELETGRTHQIRVHMSEHGHPIIGDLIYSKERCIKHLIMKLQKCANKSDMSDMNATEIIDETINELTRVRRQLLHSKAISFVHPITHQHLIIKAQLRDDMLKLATCTISPSYSEF
ncbi:Ribosomal large subunit pseudouridine synthase D [Candidatus Fokinia solitaria]|uniref:Pseudouridine synthase n=1 Tax=Candidatus Fokinia solitaria TaxID=1802984 RepID=A0A2U8BSZ5_9RICK|nr:RluA family pseudouridine synthase [Candidatus Fokinia solitaria]AWD33471.1 Ribosomal large subunit pseudouridine synthase D [Candidatus Fokinia solitaria]